MFVVTRILGMGRVLLRLFLMGALRLVVDLCARRRGGSGVGDGGLDGCGDRVERRFGWSYFARSRRVTVLVMIGFTLLIKRTSLGRQQRACEQDMKMASLLGVNINRTISLTFVMGAALACIAGLMVTLYYENIKFNIGFIAGIKAFSAAVVGGVGSLPGAMLGGLLIGLIEVFFTQFASAEYKDVAAFGVLVLVLIFRPTGLLGRPEVEKV
jgi:branched-chain amino acid transport system permease protein